MQTDASAIAQQSSVTQRRGDRIAPLDGVRALAILLVVMYHLHVPGLRAGFIGVNVFFVLSGYLITTLLLKEHARSGTIRLGPFWLRRLLRLYPALLVMVIVGVLFWPVVGDYQGAGSLTAGGAAFIALTYTGNLFRAFWSTSQGVFAPTWSLAMEEQFYLAWPVLLMGLAWFRLRRVVIIGGLAIGILASAIASWTIYDQPTRGATPDVYFNPVLNVAPLLTGCLLAVALTSSRIRAIGSGRTGAVATYAGLGSLVAALVAVNAIPDWQQHGSTFGMILPAVGLAAGLFIGGLISRPTVVSHVLAWRPLAWFGRRVSYSMYLWHVLVIVLLEPFFPGLGGKFVLLGLAALVAAAAAYAIEVPVDRLRTRFRVIRRARREADERPIETDRSRELAGARG